MFTRFAAPAVGTNLVVLETLGRTGAEACRVYLLALLHLVVKAGSPVARKLRELELMVVNINASL